MKPKTVRVNDKVQRGYTYELVAPAGPFRPRDDQGRPACLSRRPASSHSNPAKVISLMNALRQSVDAERGGNVREKSQRHTSARHRTPKKAGRSPARQKRVVPP
jgi:hypothetical protein